MKAAVPPANLQLSEILQSLVDQGEISEGSPDYLLAQKVVREGFAALSPEEQARFRSRFEPRLGAAPGEARPDRATPPFPPADLVSKRAG
jgi:hypothetical protein